MMTYNIFLETGSVVFDDYVFPDLSTEELTNLKGWWKQML